MSAHEEDRTKQLLRQVLPRVEANAEMEHDLWPEVYRKVSKDLDAQSDAQARSKWFWFDWGLAAGFVLAAISFPASIPLLLYFL